MARLKCPTKAKQFAFVPIAQWIEQDPSKVKIEVRLLVGTQNLQGENYGDHGVAAAQEFVELSAGVQIPLVSQYGILYSYGE